MSGLSGGLVLAVVLASTSPAAPPPTIERTTTSIPCTILHQEVAPSVGAILRDDVEIERAGMSVDRLASSVAAAGDGDSPYSNAGVALAQVRLLDEGNRIVRNVAEIDRELADPRMGDASNPRLAAIRHLLEQVRDQQRRLESLIFEIAYSDHPADVRTYSLAVQQEIRDSIRWAAPGAVSAGVFAPFDSIAHQTIAKTHSLENFAAAQIQPMAETCGDIASDENGGARSPSATVHLDTAAEIAAAGTRAGEQDAAARAFYDTLANDRVDRTKLSPALDAKFSASFVTTIAEELTVLGPASWEYAGAGTSATGPVTVYRLTYASGTKLYYAFGTNAGGAIVAIFIGTQRPPQ